MGWAIFIGIIVLIAIIGYWQDLSKDREAANKKLEQLSNKIANLFLAKDEIKSLYEESCQKETDVKKLIQQRSQGFPLLGEVFAEYFKLKDDTISTILETKKRPAFRAAEMVKESNKEKRELAKNLKIAEYKLKNYELIAPFLAEIDEELPSNKDESPVSEDNWMVEDYTEEETQDMTTRFLTKEEYHGLSASDRNQLALDRYWSSRKRSKWLIGKMYERYIGFLYEQKGYQVEYFGIKERYEDLGRDLIAKKGKEIHIVQCKNWSKYKTIYENHIFQLFGTTFEYSERNKVKAKSVFFTTTKLSEIANEMCIKLGMEVIQNFPLEIYPSIKCNISRKTEEKIYHLPFDQQYDHTTIEEDRLEKYVTTVEEAEKLGFRRAFRWHGSKE
jgi:hypothetical protein